MDFGSDDDDDDDILAETTALLRRPKRATGKEKAEQRKKAKQMSLLDSALESADRSAMQSHRLSRMQSENSEGGGNMIRDDELQRRIEQAAESARSKPEFSVQQIANGLGDHMDDGAHDKVTKTRIAEAIDTQGTVYYGLRPTINFEPKRDETLRFFQDKAHTIKEIQFILSKNQSFGGTISNMLSNSANPQELLANFLKDGGISKFFQKDSGELSVELAGWLFCMACSTRAHDRLSTTATEVLVELIQQNRLSDQAMSTFDEAGRLVAWCDLRHWPLENTEGRDDALNRQTDRNLGGLANCVALWTASLTASLQEKIAMDDASMALKVLFFVGIDPAVVSPTYSIGLQAATRQLIHMIVHKMEQSLDSGALKDECGRCLAKDILGPLVDEVKEILKSEKHGKSQSFLTFPAMIRAASVRNQKGPNPLLLSVLLCEMACQSLSAMALSDPVAIESIDACLPELTRKAFAYAKASVDVMCEWGSELVLHAPQALAMTECATHAIRSGLSMMSFPYNNDEKIAVASFLDDMDEHVSTFTGRLRAIGQNDFLRQLDFHWTGYRQYGQEIYGRITKASSPSGLSTPKQKTLKSFFRVEDSQA